MMRIWIAVLTALWLGHAPPVHAGLADLLPRDAGGAGRHDNEPQGRVVTEAEFARWLCDRLGLTRQLPRNPTPRQCFALLEQNGIHPADGWQALDVVTGGTLARVLVQAMGREDAVRDPADDRACIQYLKTLGIQIPNASQPDRPVTWGQIQQTFRPGHPHPPPPCTPT